MEFEDGLRMADEAVVRLKRRHLNNAERTVLEGAWYDWTYQEIADRSEGRYKERYLKQDVGAKLWKLLTEAFGGKVSKKTLRTALEALSRAAEMDLPNSPILSPLPSTSTPPKPDPWGELEIDVSNFYGRQSLLSMLNTWIVHERCQLVVMCGMRGVGKTALSQTLNTQICSYFTHSICLSLRLAPSLTELLVKLLCSFTDFDVANIPATVEGQLTLLIQHFRQQSCLVILDDTEAIAQPGALAGRERDGYEHYRELLKGVAATLHQSCLVWVGQEEPEQYAELTGYKTRRMAVPGMALDEALELLQSKLPDLELTSTQVDLVNRCNGNPLVLILACKNIELFGTAIDDYWPSIINQLQDLLDEQFARLSPDEMSLMYRLAIAQAPLSLKQVQDNQLPYSTNIHRVVQSLTRRSLCIQIASPSEPPQFTITTLVMEYVLQRCVRQLTQEIVTGNLNVLRSHALLYGQEREYIREQQRQRLLKPLANCLRHSTELSVTLENHLIQLLSTVCRDGRDRPDYAIGNLINLCQQLDINWADGFSGSGLALWHADLSAVNLNRCNLTHSDVSQAIFAYPLGSALITAFSPSGRYLATADEDGRILLWQVVNQQLSLLHHTRTTSSILSLAFNHMEDLLAAGGEDHTIKVWEVQTGRQWPDLIGLHHPVRCLCFSPDGQWLASGSSQTIGLWNVYSQQCRHTWNDQDELKALYFDATGDYLISCSDPSIHVWRLSSISIVGSLPSNTYSWSNAIAVPSVPSAALVSELTPLSSTILAVELDDKAIKLWRVASGEMYRNFPLARSGDQTEAVVSIALSRDSQWMAISIMVTESPTTGTSRDRYLVRLWDIQARALVQTIDGFNSRVQALALSADGKLLATSSPHQLQLWSVRDGRCLHALRDYRTWVDSFTLNADSTLLVVGHQDQTLRLWHLETERCYRLSSEGTYAVKAVAISVDGQTIASCGDDPSIRLWDVSRGSLIRTLSAHAERIRVVRFSPNDQWLASGSNDHTINLWNLSTGRRWANLTGHHGPIHALCFSPDSLRLASGSSDRTIRLWDVMARQLVQEFSGHQDRIHSLSISADGRWLVSGSHDETVRIWDVATATCEVVWPQSTDRINAVVVDSQQRAIAASSSTRLTTTIELWDIRANQRLQTLVWEQPSRVLEVNFGPLGDHLASGTQDGIVRIWHWPTGRCLRVLHAASPYVGMNIRDIQEIPILQQELLLELGAVEE